MNGAEVLVPLTMFAGGFAMIFGIYYLRTKENLSMLDKGINPKLYSRKPAPFRTLKAGLLLVGAGLGLLLAYIIDVTLLKQVGMMDHGEHNPAIYFALIAIGGGIGLVISYVIEKKHMTDLKQADIA